MTLVSTQHSTVGPCSQGALSSVDSNPFHAEHTVVPVKCRMGCFAGLLTLSPKYKTTACCFTRITDIGTDD